MKKADLKLRPQSTPFINLSLVKLLAVSAVSLPAFAAQPSETEAGALETITVTASRIEQPLMDQSSSLSVVTGDEIKMVSAVHVNELLTRVPGVWITRGNGQEHLTAIRSPVLTGAGSCGSFYAAEDGVSVKPTGFCNVNQLFDINTEQAARIEVLRGPGTTYHHSDAVHGVINVISQPPSAYPESIVGLEAGPNDYGRIKLSTSDSTEQFGYRINLNGSSDGGYQDNSGYDQQKMTARFDYQGDAWLSKTLVSVSNLNQETAGYVVGTDAYKDDDIRTENPNPEAYRDSQAARWQTHFERELNNGSALILTPYARHSKMDFLMHFLPGQPVEENGQTSAGLQTNYRMTLNPKVVLSQGVDVEFTDAYLKQTQAEDFNSLMPAGDQYDYDVTALMLAGFISAEYQSTERLNFSLGARYETLKYDYDNQMISGNTDDQGELCVNPFTGEFGCRYSRPEDRKDDFENLSVNFGAVYHLSDAFITTGRLTQGFRAPQATELYRLQSGQLIANLESEEINSAELGFKGVLYDFSYDLVGYYMTKDNVIFQSSERENLDNGETKHYGLEYLFFWQWSQQWDLTASGSFARHQYTTDVSAPGTSDLLHTDGKDMVSAPRRMSSMQLGWDANDKTRIELQWVVMGKYYTDLDNLHQYDGHNLVHLRMRHQLNESIGLGLRINNLTDKYYAERADYSGFAGDRYFVGLPRSVYADVQFRW